jgi:hypothetical protein
LEGWAFVAQWEGLLKTLSLGLVLALFGCIGDNTDQTQPIDTGILRLPKGLTSGPLQQRIITTLEHAPPGRAAQFSESISAPELCLGCTITFVPTATQGQVEIFDDRTGESLGMVNTLATM